MIRVYEQNFWGSECVLESDNPQKVAQFLIDVGAYKGHMMMDGGYILQLENGNTFYQGYDKFDEWVKNNIPLTITELAEEIRESVICGASSFDIVAMLEPYFKK